MTDTPSSGNMNADEDIRRLLRLAGPRLQPPADVEARVRAATMAAVAELPLRAGAEPADVTGAESGRWLKRFLPVAAALLLAVLVGYQFLPTSGPGEAGTIVYASGAYTVRGTEAAGNAVTAGSIVRTSASGRLLIDLGGERALRVDRSASLTLHDRSEIWLHHGRIYVDSRGVEPVTVVTPNASITDVGTQFEVSVDHEELVVATREGIVDVTVGSETVRSQAEPGNGEVLRIEGLSLVARDGIPTSGERWAWTQLARPLFNAQDRSIRDYLEWAAREEGKTLRFSSRLAAQQAELRTLHATGEIDADPDTLAGVLATSAFETVPGSADEIVVALRASN